MIIHLVEIRGGKAFIIESCDLQKHPDRIQKVLEFEKELLSRNGFIQAHRDIDHSALAAADGKKRPKNKTNSRVKEKKQRTRDPDDEGDIFPEYGNFDGIPILFKTEKDFYTPEFYNPGGIPLLPNATVNKKAQIKEMIRKEILRRNIDVINSPDEGDDEPEGKLGALDPASPTSLSSTPQEASNVIPTEIKSLAPSKDQQKKKQEVETATALAELSRDGFDRIRASRFPGRGKMQLWEQGKRKKEGLRQNKKQPSNQTLEVAESLAKWSDEWRKIQARRDREKQPRPKLTERASKSVGKFGTPYRELQLINPKLLVGNLATDSEKKTRLQVPRDGVLDMGSLTEQEDEVQPKRTLSPLSPLSPPQPLQASPPAVELGGAPPLEDDWVDGPENEDFDEGAGIEDEEPQP